MSTKSKNVVKTTVLYRYSVDGKKVKLVRTDTKNRSKVTVCVATKDEDLIYKTFTFKRLNQSFVSPYISWANQACCEAWPADKMYLLNAVQDGKRLFSSVTQYAPTMEEKAQIEHETKMIEAQLPDGVFCGCEPLYVVNRPDERNYIHLYICRAGKLADFYNLDEVFAFYERLGVTLNYSEKEDIKRLCQCDIRDFGRHQPYNYAAAKTTVELIVSGLLLGYPLETTSHMILNTTCDDYGVRDWGN